GYEGLRLASGEDSRPMRAGEDADLAPDAAHFVERPPVQTDAPLDDLVTKDLLFQLLEDVLRVETPLDFALGQRRDELFEHLVDAVVVLELPADAHGLGQRHEDFFFDLAVEVVADLLLRDLQLRAADLARQIVDAGDDLLDRSVCRFERLDDLLLGDL